MKYNSTLFNKLFNTTNNNNNNNQINTNSSIINNNNNNIKVSPSSTSTSSTTTTTSNTTNMAAAIVNTPISNALATSTRFTDEYDLKEDLGKWVIYRLFYLSFLICLIDERNILTTSLPLSRVQFFIIVDSLNNNATFLSD